MSKILRNHSKNLIEFDEGHLQMEEIYSDSNHDYDKFVNVAVIEVDKTSTSHVLKILNDALPLAQFGV